MMIQNLLGFVLNNTNPMRMIAQPGQKFAKQSLHVNSSSGRTCFFLCHPVISFLAAWLTNVNLDIRQGI